MKTQNCQVAEVSWSLAVLGKRFGIAEASNNRMKILFMDFADVPYFVAWGTITAMHFPAFADKGPNHSASDGSAEIDITQRTQGTGNLSWHPHLGILCSIVFP